MPDSMPKSAPESPSAALSPDENADGIEHGYGPRVHILEDAWTAAATAKLSSPDCTHTELVQAVPDGEGVKGQGAPDVVEERCPHGLCENEGGQRWQERKRVGAGALRGVPSSAQDSLDE